MLFNSYHFMFFFPLVLLVYFLIPKKLRYLWLLVVSYYFYMSWSPKYAILILLSTVITYLSGLLIVQAENEVEDKEKKVKYKKGSVIFSICLNLAILFFFKYSNFLLDNLNSLFELLHISFRTPRFYFILPVGISFYTFQALSYTIDVYRGDIEAEKNLLEV